MYETSFAPDFLTDFLIENSSTSEPTVCHLPSGITLHSGRDPWREANDMASEWTREHVDNIMLWGFGLGYVAEALLNRLNNETRLWIIEIHPELAALAKQLHPSWELWNDERVKMFSTQSARILHTFFNEIPSNARVCIHAPSQALLRWNGGKLSEILESLTLPVKNSRTDGIFIEAQREANAPYLTRCKAISELFHLWNNEPVLILGAGPSLASVLDDIDSSPQRPRMIASNGALPVLANRGIMPDIAVCIESRKSAFIDIEKSDFTGPLVVFPAVNHELLRTFKGTLYLAVPSEEPESREENTLISGAGTVMAPALDLASKLGGNPLLLAGLDLGWGENFYAAGANRNRTKPQASVRATDIAGRTFWTSPAFAAFGAGIARIVEQLHVANPNLRIYDVKSSGLRISGTTPLSPERLSELLLSQQENLAMSPL